MNIRSTWCIAVVVLLLYSLWGCVSATRMVRNKEATVRDYHDVYLVEPSQDPRHVVPKVIAGFEAMGLKVTMVDPSHPLGRAQGTGFVISEAGHVLTCAHVLGEETTATVWISGVRYEADVLNKDTDKDVAVLKVRGEMTSPVTPVSFRNDERYGLGADVVTIGFPLSSMLGNSARLTKGSINSTSGLKDDPKQIQISAPIQPGSSGGPVLDSEGVVLGVVQETLNPTATFARTGGALPQNVNFAIKGKVVLDYLRQTQPDVYRGLAFNRATSFDDVQKAVVKIRSGIVPPELENRPKLVATLKYRSRWDVWYRFTLFVIVLYDFDSHQPLLAAGQGRDNMVSTEDVVIRDTFAEIRRALGEAPSDSAPAPARSQ